METPRPDPGVRVVLADGCTLDNLDPRTQA
jgi:hypothetical protein